MEGASLQLAPKTNEVVIMEVSRSGESSDSPQSERMCKFHSPKVGFYAKQRINLRWLRLNAEAVALVMYSMWNPGEERENWQRAGKSKCMS